jgi:hypothetical protein
LEGGHLLFAHLDHGFLRADPETARVFSAVISHSDAGTVDDADSDAEILRTELERAGVIVLTGNQGDVSSSAALPSPGERLFLAIADRIARWSPTLAAWLLLRLARAVIKRHGLRAVIRSWSVPGKTIRPSDPSNEEPVERLHEAVVDAATGWFAPRVACKERMLAALRLGIAFGLCPTMRLLIQPAPLELHVQALIGGRVVGDHPHGAARFPIHLEIRDDGGLGEPIGANS